MCWLSGRQVLAACDNGQDGDGDTQVETTLQTWPLEPFPSVQGSLDGIVVAGTVAELGAFPQ